MAEKRQNYCQLLGLNPLKESSYSTEAILKKIETKRGKWANDSRNKQNDTEQRFKSERLVEMTTDMERVMKDPILKRKEFSDAATLLKGKAQKLRMDCIILSDGSYIALPGAADSYTKKLHWEGVVKSDVLKLAGIKEGSPPKPAGDKILNAYKGLRAVDAYTPIEMLNTLIQHPNLEIDLSPLSEGSSFSQIRSAFEVCDKRVNSVRPDVLPEQDSYIQTMRSVKLVLEPDKELSTLIAYGKCNRALIPVMETIEQEYTTQLSRKYIDELLNAHLTKDIDSKMAIEILQQFCHKKKIAANFSEADSSMIRCPECGNMVQTGPNTVFCPSCGKNFKTVCPACGTAQQSRNQICVKCGFNFKEGMEKANRLALDFRMNMQKGKVGKAEKSLAQLKDTYSGYAGIAGMEVELQKAKTNMSTMRKLILDSYSKGRYTEAKTACESLVDQYPDALSDDLELKQKYGDCVTRYNAADLYCQKASVADSKPQRMAMYVAAVEICQDHPVAKAKLREDPPSGPADAYGKLGDRSFTIKFMAPADANGVTYCIYREKNSLPRITEDTRPLAEVPTTVYVDKTLEPGVEYYYSIYSKRWGILSKEGAHLGPVMTISEVDTVTLEPIDGGLRIMYEKPRGATRVRLWRTDGNGSGIGTEIALNGQTVYDDIGLVGGRKYHYLFVAEYEGRNKVERSQGVVFSGTTVDAPKPVKDMKIKWNKTDGTYTAKWGTTEPVTLYCTPKKITIPGNMVKMDDIVSWMKPIEPIMEYSDGIRFSLPDGAVQYIYPIIPRGKVGIKGTEMMVANLKPFRDVEKTISNKDCVITMAWPDDAVEAKLVISNGEVRGLDDIDAEIKTVRREEYMEERQIRIPMGHSAKKCINIFALYKINDEMIASRGIAVDVYSAECRKVRYTVKQEKGGMRMDFSTDPDIGQIPPIVAVQVAVGIPLKRTDGEIIWRSHNPVALAQGKGTLTVQCKNLEDPARMRLFFENDADYNMFRFMHPLYDRRS